MQPAVAAPLGIAREDLVDHVGHTGAQEVELLGVEHIADDHEPIATKQLHCTLDPNETLPITDPPSVDLTFTPDFRGDTSGMVQASVIFPGLDFDLDTFLNETEILAGSNPFDAGNEPATPSVENLTCDVDNDAASVTLGWVNPFDDYTSFEVYQDDVLIETLGASTTSTTVEELDEGTYSFAVVGIVEDVPLFPVRWRTASRHTGSTLGLLGLRRDGSAAARRGGTTGV